MNLFGTQMHLFTALLMLLEVMLLLFYQLPHYLQRPQDRQRFWFLILLLLLIHYNLWNGLLPDTQIFHINIKVQYMLIDGIAYLMGAYFPYYFYKAFDLKSLRFHATWGVTLFLLLPYVIFDVLYFNNGQLMPDRLYCLAIPVAYGFVILISIYRAIRYKHRKTRGRQQYLLEIAAFLALLPWEVMGIFAIRTPTQETRIIIANLGFIVLAFIQMAANIRQSRLEERRSDMLLNEGRNTLFEANCILYQLTKREVEIVLLLRRGYRYREIADRLFIAERTVDKHVRNIYEKTSVNNRTALLNKLYGEDGSLGQRT